MLVMSKGALSAGQAERYYEEKYSRDDYYTEKQRVIVEGTRMIKKHMRKSQQYPQGQIIEREGSIHISNVMKVEDFDARAAKHTAGQPAQAAS